MSCVLMTLRSELSAMPCLHVFPLANGVQNHAGGYENELKVRGGPFKVLVNHGAKSETSPHRLGLV